MRLLVILAILAVAPAAYAQSVPRMPGVEYFCTGANGERYELGEVICITASCQTWMARCDMSLNSPMWRKLSDGCPGAAVSRRIFDENSLNGMSRWTGLNAGSRRYGRLRDRLAPLYALARMQQLQ